MELSQSEHYENETMELKELKMSDQHKNQYTYVVPHSWANCDDFTLKDLGLGFFRDDNATLGLGNGLRPADQDSVEKGKKPLCC